MAYEQEGGAMSKCRVCGGDIREAHNIGRDDMFRAVLPLLVAARDALSADNGSKFEHDSFAIMDDAYWEMLANLSDEQRREVER